jgi:Cu/Ag efflux protein CusF
VKYPGDPSDYAKMDAATMLAGDKGQYEVTDLGMKLKDGQMLHAYKAVNKTRNTTETVYLDSAGRIARMEMPAMMMQFSNYGEAVDIKAPI